MFCFLQRNDIAMAITKYDQFDFLIDIVPREELKPPAKRSVSQRLLQLGFLIITCFLSELKFHSIKHQP